MFQSKISPSETVYEEPTHQTPEEASAALRAFLGNFVDDLEKKFLGAPVVLVEATTGLGKSHQARLMIHDYLRKNPEKTVVVFVQTHRLGKEQLDAFNALESRFIVKHFLGTAQIDPESSDNRMCHRSEIVASLCANGISLKDLCAKPNDGLFCPHHIDNPETVSVCGYSRQSKQRANIWIMVHQMLFHQPPKCVGNVGLIVIDESFWQSGLSSSKITLAALEVQRKTTSVVKTAGLARKTTILGRAAASAIRTMPDGFIDTRKIFEALDSIWVKEGYGKKIANFSDICARGEWTVFSICLQPDMSIQELEKTADLLSQRSVLNLARFWQLLGASEHDATPLLVKNTMKTKDGPVQYVNLYWMETIARGWHVPTVTLDATPCEEVTRWLFPTSYYRRLEVEKFTCSMKHVSFTQVTDRKLSKQMMVLTDNAGGKKNRERKHNLVRLSALLQVLGTQGKTLLVTSKAIEEAIKDQLPENVDSLHYGALAGLDEFRNHQTIILAGRLELPLQLCEHTAGIIQKKMVTPVQGVWYGTTRLGIYTAEDMDICVDATRHDDPIAEEVRWAWNEGNLIQAIGRGRGIRRTANNPLNVFICANVPLPIKVDHAVKWNELVPCQIELNIALKGVECLSPMEMVRIDSGCYKDRNAARYALKKFRERYIDYPAHPAATVSPCPRGGENAYIDTLIGKFTPPSLNEGERGQKMRLFKLLLVVEFKRPISGANWCRAVIRPGHGYPSAKDCLEKVLGTVKDYRCISVLQSKPPSDLPKVQPGIVLFRVNDQWEEKEVESADCVGNVNGRMFYRTTRAGIS